MYECDAAKQQRRTRLCTRLLWTWMNVINFFFLVKIVNRHYANKLAMEQSHILLRKLKNRLSLKSADVYFSFYFSLSLFCFENRRKTNNSNTYNSAGFIVVQIHFLAKSATTFTGVNEFAREFKSKSNVIRTTTPFPVTNTDRRCAHVIHLWRTRLMAIVTCTWFNWTFATCTGNRMRNSRTCYGINERCFATTWKKSLFLFIIIMIHLLKL